MEVQPTYGPSEFSEPVLIFDKRKQQEEEEAEKIRLIELQKEQERIQKEEEARARERKKREYLEWMRVAPSSNVGGGYLQYLQIHSFT